MKRGLIHDNVASQDNRPSSLRCECLQFPVRESRIGGSGTAPIAGAVAGAVVGVGPEDFRGANRCSFGGSNYSPGEISSAGIHRSFSGQIYRDGNRPQGSRARLTLEFPAAWASFTGARNNSPVRECQSGSP